MIQWHIVDSATYKNGVKNAEDLYFLSDTHEIYRGEEAFTESVILYTSLPTTSIAKNRLYIDSTTLEGKIHDGTEWKTVIKPVDTTVTADGANAVTGAAVATYVTAELAKVQAATDIVSTITWDAADHILTATAKDGKTKQDITLSGLGVNLSYVPATGALQLLDAAGEKIGDAISLPLEQFVKSGEYDPKTKSIILYFDDEKQQSVTIPVGDLVDTYTAESTKSIEMSVTDNKFTASIKLSGETGNQLVIKDDGVYVGPTDLSNYMTLVPDAVEGHLVTLDASGQVVDSGKSFADLATNAKIYQGASIDEALNGATAKAGDFCVVNTAIGETDKVQKTAYYYDGTNWVAFDGNYSAENVYFPEDLMTTSAIGNITLTNGQATIAAKGKNIKEVWNSIFVKAKNPTITQPSVSITKPVAATLEVGSTYTPEFAATLNAGKYEYGPATGITATEWEVTDTADHSATSNTGSFDSFIVADDTQYKITAKATYGDGAIPINNIGDEYPSGKIAAGSKSATSGVIKGYRAGFYGALSDKTGEINSALVRALGTKTTGAPSNDTKWTITVPDGATRVVFAYPATLRDVSSVLDVGGMNAEIKSAFTLHTVDVEGAAGYTAKSYKVYVTDFAEPQVGSNTYAVTI